jgi:hypothetical protein
MADVCGRRVIQGLFIGRVFVEPGDGAQPPVTVTWARPLASRSRAKLAMLARPTLSSTVAAAEAAAWAR